MQLAVFIGMIDDAPASCQHSDNRSQTEAGDQCGRKRGDKQSHALGGHRSTNDQFVCPAQRFPPSQVSFHLPR